MAVAVNTELKEELLDLNKTRKVVENAENRARREQRKKATKISLKNERSFAQDLHREADQLYQSGDYESALVLYHRAANFFPRDSSHSVAARRTAATISSCNNPTKALRKVLPNPSTDKQLTASLCPETAATIASEKLKKLPTPGSVVELLSYFDNHKAYWNTLPSPRVSSIQLSRSKVILKQLSNLAEVFLENLQLSFNSGKMTAALQIAQELLIFSAGLLDPSRYQIAAYDYLSLIHVALGRHDRAVCSASRLVRLSKSTQDVGQICRALVTLGKVHLSFGHLDAAARAWEYLSKELKEPIPIAWIRHEIGRCYLETDKSRQALEMANRCVEAAMEGNSKKWILNGKLLQGQSLAKLGRFTESLDELKIAAKITEEEGDTPMLSYIRDLIDQVTRALETITSNTCSIEESKTSSKMEQDPTRQFASRAETVITTMFYQRQVITKYRSRETSSEDSADEKITASLEKIPIQCIQKPSEIDFEDGDQQSQRGNSTFRVQKSPSTTSASSVHSDQSDRSEEEELESERESDGMENEKSEEEKDELDCKEGSQASLKSTNTTATYVISTGSGTKMEEVESKIDRSKGILNLVDDIGEGEEVASDKIAEKEEDMLKVMQTIEELGSKNEMELLDMLRDMLLTEGEEDRSLETRRTLDIC